MQKLQLYIKGERVDLFKDENVSFTQTIQNVKDIGKIFTEFTKTFAVPASKTNNKIFKHYYNFDVVGGFDSRNKQLAKIELNDLPFKEGKIKLNGVKLKNNVPHTYNITFFGNTVNLKDILADSQVSSLTGLAQYNKIYSFTDIVAALQSSTNSGNILVPFITHTDQVYYDSNTNNEAYGNLFPVSNHVKNGVSWKQFKYAIRVQAIIDAIESEVFSGGQTISFSNDFFNDSSNEDFYNLYLWLHRKKGDVESSTEVLQNFTQVNELSTVVCVPANNCQPTVSSVSNGIVSTHAQSPYSISFLYVEVVPPNTTDVYTVKVIRNGSEIVGETTGTGNQNLILIPYNDSTYAIQIASSTLMTFTAGNIKMTVSWTTGIIGGYGNNGQTIYSNASSFTDTADVDFNINEQMPKMTIMDFLTGLFQMFNLTAYVDNSGTKVVRTIDSYYNAGSSTPINIDKYLDTTKSAVDVALPFKEVDFTYKGLGTKLAKRFEQTNNSRWGSLAYTLDGSIYDAPTSTYKIELPFEHMQYERLYDVNGGASTTIQYGRFVDDNDESYFGEPLLFYPIRQVGGTALRIQDLDATTKADIDDYYIPSNSLALAVSTSKVNIHFGNEVNEYLAFEPVNSTNFTNTLFVNGYRTYIKEVFDVSRRLTKVTAYLPFKIYYNLQLNDLIQLGQNNYKINSLKTNLITGKTDFELLNDVVVPDPLDNLSPTQPTGLVASNITQTSFDLTWNASTSPSGITMSYYLVYSGGVQVGGVLAQPLQSTYTDTITGLNPATSYPMTVVAFDVQLNQSPTSDILVVNTLT